MDFDAAVVVNKTQFTANHFRSGFWPSASRQCCAAASPKDGTLPKEADIKVLERGQLRIDPERHTCTWKNEPVTLNSNRVSTNTGLYRRET